MYVSCCTRQEEGLQYQHSTWGGERGHSFLEQECTQELKVLYYKYMFILRLPLHSKTRNYKGLESCAEGSHIAQLPAQDA